MARKSAPQAQVSVMDPRTFLTRIGDVDTVVAAESGLLKNATPPKPLQGVHYANVVHDVFARLYLDKPAPDIAETSRPGDLAVANAIHQALDDSPETRRIHAWSKGRVGSSQHFTRSLLEGIMRECGTKLQALAADAEKAAQAGVPVDEAKVQDAADRAFLAARGAVTEAVTEDEEYRAVLHQIFGVGKDAILDDAKADPQMRVWHAVAKKQLTEFAVLVGAFRDSIRSRAQLKARRGQIGDVAGVHPSRVLERLMPMELAKMAHMPTRLYALDAYMKGKMLAYEHVEMIRQDRGPVAILLDRSGSMEHPADCQLGSVAVRGTKMTQAKSLCVALCIVLSEQGRDCCIIPFNQTSGKRIDWRWETPESQVKTLVLAFAVSPSGGTNFDPPVADGFRWRGDCDVLMVSDGVGAFTPARHPQLATRKLAYIVLGNDHDVQQDLKAAATWSMAVTSLDQAIETVAELAV